MVSSLAILDIHIHCTACSFIQQSTITVSSLSLFDIHMHACSFTTTVHPPRRYLMSNITLPYTTYLLRALQGGGGGGKLQRFRCQDTQRRNFVV